MRTESTLLHAADFSGTLGQGHRPTPTPTTEDPTHSAPFPGGWWGNARASSGRPRRGYPCGGTRWRASWEPAPVGKIVGHCQLQVRPPERTQECLRRFAVGASFRVFPPFVQPFSWPSSGFSKEGGAHLWPEPEGHMGTTESPHPLLFTDGKTNLDAREMSHAEWCGRRSQLSRLCDHDHAPSITSLSRAFQGLPTP